MPASRPDETMIETPTIAATPASAASRSRRSRSSSQLKIAAVIGACSFRQAIVLYPIATAVHVLEEWPGFPRWARRFASSRYSDREYVITHALTMAGAVAIAKPPMP